MLVKREDLNHVAISGNKWWKLQYNLEAVIKTQHQTILTFGGAFSNHIYSTAAAARELKLKVIGIIRGEQTLPLNPTLAFAVSQGMQIHYINRDAYRQKDSAEFLGELQNKFGPFFLIPEGGSNQLAVKGCAEFAGEQLAKIDFDHLFLPVGTGGTIAGMICGLKDTKEIIGVPVLKNGGFLSDEIEKMAAGFSGEEYNHWRLLTQYHHGGFAKMSAELLSFIEAMKIAHDLPLDPVYTGKLFWAIMKEVEGESFKRGSTILALHTGGLQGMTAG